MNIANKKNKILCCIDLSYWLYYTVFGTVSEFQKKYPEESKIWIKRAEEVDQSNLPDLLNCENFKKILKKFVMKRLETIDWQLKSKFQNKIDCADGIDFVFAKDDFLRNSFRKEIYPEYKAQRKLIKKSFNQYKIHEYIINVLFKELDENGQFGYHIIGIPGAEGDDIIATLFLEFGKEYMLNVLFASDKDFIQLENVYQLNLYGKDVEPCLGGETLTKKEYLLAKIILGDTADNINKVFKNVGDKKVLKLVKDSNLLKQKLSESKDAVRQFQLNSNLISFQKIPENLTKTIKEEISKALFKNEVLNKDIDFSDFMSL